MSQTLVASFKAARRASTPLVCIRTADPAATMREISANLNGTAPPILVWDIICGLRGVNESGKKAAASANINSEQTVNIVEALIACGGIEHESMIFFSNAHRVIAEQGVSQALWNLRDPFKKSRRTIVLLCPSIDLPVEIQQDVTILDEPLPDNTQLGVIVQDIYKSAELEAPKDISKAVDAICGLSAFSAEQVCAMSITKSGLDMEALWSRKVEVIEQQKGLSVWRGKEMFADIGGYSNLKTFLGATLKGKQPPRGVIFLDEIEKSIGTGQDTSGVSQALLGQLLTWMNDNDAVGLLLIGPPGTSKSMFAKATGNEGNVPTIALDLGGTKGSLVGESEAAMRNALKVCDTVTQKRALFLGTCNSIGALPPELRRRFSLGVFFLDLPDATERKTIWDIYLKKYGLKKNFKDDAGWTGAEIKQCCWIAWNLNISIQEASAYIVPVSRSASEQMERLRQQADGRFISASYPGVYQKTREGQGQSRNISLD
jgi:hypothetical protein